MLPWEPMLFMFFSTIELMSIYYLIMSLFRFKWKHHAWQALFVTLIINLQSYLVRKELDMSNIAPLILIVIFILFFAAVVRMPSYCPLLQLYQDMLFLQSYKLLLYLSYSVQ